MTSDTRTPPPTENEGDVTCPECGEAEMIYGYVNFCGEWEVGPDGVGSQDAISITWESTIATWDCMTCGHGWRARKPT